MKITEDELAEGMSAFLGAPYARLLAELDTAIKKGEEARLNSVVLDLTGHAPKKLEVFIDECVKSGVWVPDQEST